MAKSTNAQENATGSSDSYSEHELSDPSPPYRVQRFQLGDDAIFRGVNSPQSGQSALQPNDGGKADPLSRVPMMENPSERHPEEETPSIAPLMVGNGQSSAQQPSDEIPPYEEWTLDELKKECRLRGLHVSGNKDELIDRLTTDDEAAS